MTLKDHIGALSTKRIGNNPKSPRAWTISNLAAQCHVTDATIYRWLRGEVETPLLCREKVSEIIGISIEELFPSQE